ncbi:hypothetical protein Lser_V15G18157 [Lactuca serriola]
MADSSSVHATSHILPIRLQQSLIIDLTPHAYDAFMFPIIECLKFSPLAPALTKVEAVPMECLSQIFSTAHYDKSVDRIFFDILDHKASISKQRFCSLLGFEPDSSRVNPESIPVVEWVLHPKVDRDLVEFYLKAAQPQYQTWSAQKIANIRVLKPFRQGNFTNVRFKVLRGSAKTEHAISLADLPNLNPHDWIILHNILLTNEAEYGPIIDHFKRMLVCYIMEVAKMDQEIASIFKKKPTISPVGSASDLNMMQMGKIDPKQNFVMFTRNEGQKCLFTLAYKHLYTTACLKHVLGIIHRCKQNSTDDKKYFDDMIQWYIRFRQKILALIPRLFETTKKVPAAGPSKKK